MEEKDLNYIKVRSEGCREWNPALILQMINAGERLIINNRSFGYLSHRIVFYLLNLHIKSRHTYFARVRSNHTRASSDVAPDAFRLVSH